MNFGRFDVIIFLSMSVAVIVMSFTFPAMGLTGENVDSAEIPEYNTSNAAWEFLEEAESPEFPNSPSQGTLEFTNSSDVFTDNRRLWIEGDTSDGIELILLNNGTDSNPEAEIILNNWTAGSTETDRLFLDEGESGSIENFSYVFSFENTQFSNVGTQDVTITVDWQIVQQPGDTVWYARIPVLGSIVSGGEQLAGIVGWGVSLVWYYLKVFSVSIVGILLEIAGFIFFLIDLGHWLITSYSSIITGAPAGWVSVLLSVPGLLLSLQFMKAIVIGIRTLPST